MVSNELWGTWKAKYDKHYFVDRCGHFTKDGIPTHTDENKAKFAQVICDFFDNIETTLDLGCSSGWLTHGFSLLGKDAYGVDVGAYAINHSDIRIRSKLSVCDISEGLPFESQFFDLVTGFDILEHIPGYDRLANAIAEICRVCRRWIFLRQPMIDFVKQQNDSAACIAIVDSLNPLPHKVRLELIKNSPEIKPAIPLHIIDWEHPSTHSIDFWVAFFEAYGFSEIPLPEESLRRPNPLSLCSYNALAFEKIKTVDG